MKADVLVLVLILGVLVIGEAQIWNPFKKRRPSRTTTTTTPYVVTTLSWYPFEGVDWQQMPDFIQEEHYSCFGHYYRCTRVRVILHPSCGYDKNTQHYEDFYNTCEVELQACLERVKLGIGVYGKSVSDDTLFHNGEDHDCYYYYRRVRSKEEMDYLYFKGRKDEILGYKE